MEWIALFDFVPTESRHIGLSKGDRILEVQHQGNGWAYGHNANTERFGAFPSNYVDNNLNLFEPQQHTIQDVTIKEHQHISMSSDDNYKIERNKDQIKISKTPNNESSSETSKPMRESHFKEDSNNMEGEMDFAERSKSTEELCEELKFHFKADSNGMTSSESNFAENTHFNHRNKTVLAFDEQSDCRETDIDKSNITNKQTRDRLNSSPLSISISNDKVKMTTSNTGTNVFPVKKSKTPKSYAVTYTGEEVLPTKSSTEKSENIYNQNRTPSSISTRDDEVLTSTSKRTKILPSLEAFKTPKSTEISYSDENTLPTNIVTEESESQILKVETEIEPKSLAISSHIEKELNLNFSASQIPMNSKQEQISMQTTEYKTQNPGKKKRHRQGKARLPKYDFNMKVNLQISVASGILGGLLTGGILYVLLVFNFSYSYKDAGLVIIPCTILSGLGLAFSTYVRCFILLTIPSLFTGNGRAMFLTMMFGVLLGGPVVNILHNGNEMGKSMACTTDLIKDQSLLLAKKLGEPIEKVAQRLREHFNKLKEMAGDIIEAIEPIKEALENMQNGFSAATSALKEIYKKCDSGAEDVLRKCKSGMRKARGKCEEFIGRIDPTKYVYRAAEEVINWGKGAAKAIIDFFGKRRRRGIKYLNTPLEMDRLTIIGLTNSRYKRAVLDFICAPLRIDGVCNIFKLGKFICKPFDTVGQIASKASDKIFEALREITNLFIFDIETDFDLSGGINSTKTSSEIVSQVSRDLAEKTEQVLYITNTFSKIMVLSLVFVFVKSFLYIKNYNSKDYFDNIYITKEFKKFDLACEKAGKTTVLPLRRRELRKYVFTTSFSLSMTELHGSSHGIVIVLLHFTVTSLIMVFDYLIYYVLLLAKRYGEINVNVSGVNVVKANVHGTGFIAKFLRYLTDGLQIDNAFEVDFNITKCLPESRAPDIDYIFIFFALYFVALVLVCFQSYGMRLRHKIASYFYPEREFERILWLHEKIRHKRMTSISWLFQHLKSKKKEKDVSERITLNSWFYYKFPKCATVCGDCKPKVITCLCCQVTNDGLIKFHICQTKSCDAIYCANCFKEMKKRCYRCKIKQSSLKIIKEHGDKD